MQRPRTIGRLPEHARIGEAERCREKSARYGRRFKKVRAIEIAGKLCEDCQEGGIIELATVWHHPKKAADNPELVCDPENAKWLCKRHHDARTRKGE